MSKDARILADVEKVHKLLICVSSLIHQALASNYPGLSAIFSLRLRLLRIDPQVGLVSDAETYMKTLVQLLGDEKVAERLLKSILPKKKVFEEVFKTLLSPRGRAELESALLDIVRKYEKDIKSVCKNIY